MPPYRCAGHRSPGMWQLLSITLSRSRLYSEEAARANIKLNVSRRSGRRRPSDGNSAGKARFAAGSADPQSSNLTFGGLQAYSVRASHMNESGGSRRILRDCVERALETKLLLEVDGIETPSITGASSGSYAGDAALPYITELQAGSYALMDVAYARIGGVDFGHALTVLATVISANHADRVTVDAGFKAFATDRPFGPDVARRPGRSLRMGRR